MQTKLEQFFTDRNLSTGTQRHYKAAVKSYETHTSLTLDELIEEADSEELERVRWKDRKIKSYLISFRNYLYDNLVETTAKLYFNDVKTIYRHFEIELQALPTFNSKGINKTHEWDYEDILTKKELIDSYYSANNVVKCIILLGISSGLSKVDLLNLTVRNFIEACECKNEILSEQLAEIKSQKDMIPCFKGYRQKTNKKFVTFCSPEATQHIVQYLLNRDADIHRAYEKGESISSHLEYDDKLFDISEYHLSYCLRTINDNLGFGFIGKNSKFRCHTLRKFHATTLLNNGFSVEEVDSLQGRVQDKTHRAYFHNSKEKLYEKYVEQVDELMLFHSIHEVDKAAYEQLKKENATYSSKLEEQQKSIDILIANQKELEKLIGLGE